MADVALTDRQFDLDGYVFGWRAASWIEVATIEFGAPGIREYDKPRAAADGRRFGREWRQGRTITIDVYSNGIDDTILTEVSRFCAAWDARAIREAPGAQSILRYHIAGRTRRVYGRAREIEADSVTYESGKVQITCTFDTQGPYYFGDEPVETTVGLVPPTTGGFSFPMVFPAHTTGMGERRAGLTVPGDVDAPVVLWFNGPVSQPIAEVADRWRFQLLEDYLSDQSVTVDTRPWAMSVRRSDTVQQAGRISTTSPRLPDLWLPPGTHDVVFRGHDVTGTSSLTVQAWPTYASY